MDGLRVDSLVVVFVFYILCYGVVVFYIWLVVFFRLCVYLGNVWLC